MRLIWTAAGTLFLAIGIAGVLLPMLPGTVFLFVASACFVRGNDRLHGWLVTHPVFGRQLRILRAEEPMPVKSKVMAISAMWIAVVISIAGSDVLPLQITMAVLAVIGTVVITRRY